MATRKQDDEKLTWGDRDRFRILDHDTPRIDGPAKVTGRARYTHDVRVEGMLHGRVLTCPHPVAKPTIDLEPALALPGTVVAIELDDSRPEGWTGYLGQPIAAVVAETPEQAEDAIRAIRVDYEVGEWSVTREQAIEQGTAPAFPGGMVGQGEPDGDAEAAEAALAECDAVVEATYTLPVQTHACLETHGAVVDYRGEGKAVVYSSSQHANGIPGPAGRVLELPANQVVGIVEHMGGGFGSKLWLTVVGHIACRLAKEAIAPVHLMLERGQEFLCTGNRSGSFQFLRGGANRDGKLKALVSEIQNLGGFGRGSHPGQPYVYPFEVHYTQPGWVHTNTNASVPMRAPGRPQASFAIESMVDELAYAIGHDPLELRKQNLPEEFYHRQLDRVAKEIGWADHPHRTAPPAPALLPEKAVGIGFAVGWWDIPGRSPNHVTIRIESDGSVTASSGSQDLGTGTRTFLAGVTAEVLGLPLEAVEVRIGDTRLGPAGASGGSMTVPGLSTACMEAVTKAKTALFERLAPLLETTVERLRAEDGKIADAEDGSKSMSWKEACSTLTSGGISEVGDFCEELASHGAHGAQAAKVEVDTLTGELRVLKMVCVQDCGLPLNRLATRSQMQGAMIGSLSYGLFEERVVDPWLGTSMNHSFLDYKIAGMKDVPEMMAIIDDDPRQQVIGIGEPPVIPGQSAIANAVFNACGVRVRDLPLTPDKIVNGLATLG